MTRRSAAPRRPSAPRPQSGTPTGCPSTVHLGLVQGHRIAVAGKLPRPAAFVSRAAGLWPPRRADPAPSGNDDEAHMKSTARTDQLRVFMSASCLYFIIRNWMFDIRYSAFLPYRSSCPWRIALRVQHLDVRDGANCWLSETARRPSVPVTSKIALLAEWPCPPSAHDVLPFAGAARRRRNAAVAAGRSRRSARRRFPWLHLDELVPVRRR